MKAAGIIALIGVFALASPVHALSIEMPQGSTASFEISEPEASAHFPLTTYGDQGLLMREAAGQKIIRVWKIASPSLSTLQMMTPLKEQLEAQGFQVLLECAAANCGGFDFRYRVDVLPEPEMHVDLGDFRYLTARRVENGKMPEYIGLMISRSANTGFIQMNRVGPLLPDEEQIVASTRSGPVMPAEKTVTLYPVPFVAALEDEGHAILQGLTFDTGSASLKVGDGTMLPELAAYLVANPNRHIALVGHTDAEGSLEANMALSKLRAQSVLDFLVSEYGVDPAQMEAAGVGYLAPLTTNLSDEGRTQNRRVEVILTSTR